MRAVPHHAHHLGALMTVVAVALAVFTLLSLTAGAATRGGQDAGSVTTTTTPIELGPATAVTSEPTPPTTAPERAPDVEVRGEQVFADRGASWAWWLLLLLLLPVVGFGFGVVRQRLSSRR